MLNVFVAGTYQEIKVVAQALMDACETAKHCIEADGEGKDIKVYFKDGRIEITYKPTPGNHWIDSRDTSVKEEEDEYI